ncbi:MAG: hypothetical protein RR847_01490 [Bacilli bacterium]
MKIKIIIIIVVISILSSFLIFINIKKKNAQAIILKEVEASFNEIQVIKQSTEVEDFKLVYELEFYYNDIKHEYTVNILNNDIISYEHIGDKTLGNTITEKSAKEIALNDANIKDKLDNIIVLKKQANDTTKYEIEFIYNKLKYNYIINDVGKIISFSKENKND